jgi:hypothetical protein
VADCRGSRERTSTSVDDAATSTCAGRWSLFALANSSERSRNLSSVQSPQHRPIACQRVEFDARRSKVRPTYPLLFEPGARRANNPRSNAIVRLQPHPLYRQPLNRRSSRAPTLPYFPCLPSVTRSVLVPRPAARRGSASAAPPCGFRLSENLFGKSPHRTRTKRFPEPSEKAPLGLGSGAHSRRVAQECPEGNPGKYNQGELTWHSTKTKSS